MNTAVPSPNPLWRTIVLAVVSTLAACSGSSDPAPTSSVPATPSGSALVAVSGDTVGVGTTFFDANGKGLVALSSDGEAPVSVVHVVQNTKGRRAPAANSFVTLSYDRTRAQTLVPVTSASAGGYQALVGGKPTTFTVAADGSITAGTGECKLSGKIDFATSLGGAQTVMLTVSSCGSIGNSAYTGVVFASDSTAPAAWQLIAENGTNVIDLLAYR